MVINEKNIRSVFKVIPRHVMDEIDSRIHNFISPNTIKKSIFHFNRFSEEDMELINTYFEVRAKLNLEYYEKYRFYFSTNSFGRAGSPSKNDDYTEFGYKKGIIHRETPMDKEVVSNPRKPVWNRSLEERYCPLTFRKYPDPKPVTEQQPKIVKDITPIKQPVIQNASPKQKHNDDEVSKKLVEMRENYRKQTKEIGEYTWDKRPDLTIENRQYADNIINGIPTFDYKSYEGPKKSSSIQIEDKKPSIANITDNSSNKKEETEFRSLYYQKQSSDNINSEAKKQNLEEKNDGNQIVPRRRNNSFDKTIKVSIEPAKDKDSQIPKRKLLSSNLEKALLNQPVDKEKLKYITSNAPITKPGVNNFKQKPFNYKFDKNDKSNEYTWDKRPNLEFNREYDSSVLANSANKIEKNMTRNSDVNEYTWDKRPKLK